MFIYQKDHFQDERSVVSFLLPFPVSRWVSIHGVLPVHLGLLKGLPSARGNVSAQLGFCLDSRGRHLVPRPQVPEAAAGSGVRGARPRPAKAGGEELRGTFGRGDLGACLEEELTSEAHSAPCPCRGARAVLWVSLPPWCLSTCQ